MSQIEHVRPDFHEQHRESLGNWLVTTSSEAFSDAERKLHTFAALAYADPLRPSIRSLYAILCEMLSRDSKLTGIPLRYPSPEDFRHLVLTLPGEFVDEMRYGRKLSIWNIVRSAEQVIEDIVASKIPPATR